MLYILSTYLSDKYSIAGDNYSPHEAHEHPKFQEALKYIQVMIHDGVETATYDADDQEKIMKKNAFINDCRKCN